MVTGILITLSIIAAVVTIKKSMTREKGELFLSKSNLFKGLAIGVVGIIIALIQPFNLERVDAGHVGIKVNLTGDSRGISRFEYKTGWVIINSWTSKLYEFPTYQQTIHYEAQEVITKGGFPATIKPSFNYSLKPGDIGDMFSNLRLDVKEIETKWLQTAIVGTVNDVANKWTVDDIFNNREKFENDIITEANRRVSKWFTLSQLRTNITPPPALVKSIEAKTQAIQEVQVAENQKLVAIAEGDRKVATARADSSALVISAAGEAEAIRRKQLTITPMYIEYMRVEKWTGDYPTTMVGGNGSGLMLQLPPNK